MPAGESEAAAELDRLRRRHEQTGRTIRHREPARDEPFERVGLELAEVAAPLEQRTRADTDGFTRGDRAWVPKTTAPGSG
jgi:hypothetical protein